MLKQLLYVNKLQRIQFDTYVISPLSFYVLLFLEKGIENLNKFGLVIIFG